MDYGITFISLIILLPVFLVLTVLASFDTGFPGVFKQQRVGRFGKIFTIYKFRTYHPKTGNLSKTGVWLRNTKLDELPQLFNVLKGEMSLVGPRPDVPGYYDKLKGEEGLVLFLKPGLTSEAGIRYRNEKDILCQQKDPLKYNDEILFPEKVKMNLQYYHELSFKKDVEVLLKTIFILIK